MKKADDSSALKAKIGELEKQIVHLNAQRDMAINQRNLFANDCMVLSGEIALLKRQ